MSTLPDVRGAQPGVSAPGSADALTHLDPATEVGGLLAPARAPAWDRLRDRLAALDVGWQYPLAIYLLSRVLYLVIAVADTFIRHNTSILTSMWAWDGRWYAQMAGSGYPNHLVTLVQLPNGALVLAHQWSTLGFFPLYTILMRATGQITGLPYLYAGLIVSLATGASATVLVAKLAQRWWSNARITRRTILFFCLFPGSIVFSMDYTEGLLITLVAGCLLALGERRWLLAGLLAGLSTAVGPVALAVVPACAVAAGLELRRAGWFERGQAEWSERRRALRSLAAPLLAPVGIIAFGAYLWIHTGTPFASFITQHDAWHEHSSPIAIFFDARKLVRQLLAFHSFSHPGIDLNMVSGLRRARALVPAPAIAWTLGVAALTVTSDEVPPNPRMLLCAFPLLLAVAAQLQRVAYVRMLRISTFLLVGMSLLTFVGNSLRP
jgi:hypothetical protein